MAATDQEILDAAREVLRRHDHGLAATCTSACQPDQEEAVPTIHTMPVNDTIEHTADRACPCEPVTEEVVAEDGYVGYSVAHNAADGRD